MGLDRREALALQREQALACRRGTDVELLGHGLRADELPRR